MERSPVLPPVLLHTLMEFKLDLEKSSTLLKLLEQAQYPMEETAAIIAPYAPWQQRNVQENQGKISKFLKSEVIRLLPSRNFATAFQLL